MRILVTGGFGHIGIFVCQALLSSGFQVRVLDVQGKRTRKSAKALQNKADIFWGDITDPESVRKAIQDVDGVVHMATLLPNTPNATTKRIKEVNVGGTRNLVEAVLQGNRQMPFIYASSVSIFGPTPDAKAPLHPDRDLPNPKGIYALTKLEAEQIIKSADIGYVILRLATHWHCQIFSRSEFRYMFNRSLDNRVEIAHPEDTALAIVNSVKNFDSVRGNTMIISSGPEGRMYHKDRIQALMKTFGLPMPPRERFIQHQDASDWYDTEKSQRLLHYQNKNLDDCIETYKKELSIRFTPLFLPFIHNIVGPLFGKSIVRRI